jgi:polar amino acid transport system ATP-binding protein
MIVVTHEMQFAADASDRVIFMEGGVVVESGSPQDVLIRPKHDRVRTFLRQVSHG